MIVRDLSGGLVFHHVVAFRFKPEVTAAQVVNLQADLETLAETLPGLRYYACGVDLRLREGNDDFAVAAIFETEDALRGYLDHPVHRDIVARHVASMVDEKHGAQFSLRGSETESLAGTTVGGSK